MRSGRLEHFETMSGVRAYMDNDGTGAIEIVGKDSAGRRKSVSASMTADDMLRLHHTLGEALKTRGVFVELEPSAALAKAQEAAS